MSYLTLQAAKSIVIRNARGNQVSIRHGDFVYCASHLRGDSFNVTKHVPGSDKIIKSLHRISYAELVAFISA